MSCKHCDIDSMTFSVDCFEGVAYEIDSRGKAYIEYWPDGEYDLVIHDWMWSGPPITTYTPINYCPWCGEELR